MNDIISMDAEQHRHRLNNLSDAHRVVISCMRKHEILNYLAGQVTYNMGEYPKRFSLAPTEYDYKLLKEFAENGVSLIGIHEEWSDPLRLFGADKYSTHDPEGLRAFVELVHSLKMKVTVYASTGYFPIGDPDFRPDWTSYDFYLVDLYCQYAMCSPASPEWRAYLLPRLKRIMDEYGVDGLYDDLGYEPLCYYQFKATEILPPVSPYEHLPFRTVSHFRHISPGIETPEDNSALEDMLSIVMELIHRRGGIFRVHANADKQPPCKNKVYDYLWVGESVDNLDMLRMKSMNYPPYVVPCSDLSVALLEKEDDLYLHSIPFMQFPLRVDGRPCTGERSVVEGIEYKGEEEKPTTRQMRKVYRYYKEHPDAYPNFGYWDSCPGRPEGRARWLCHLGLYLPMVKDGTYVWINIDKSELFRSEMDSNIVISLFVNDELYLVMANYGNAPKEVISIWNWRDRETGETGYTWTVPSRGLLFLQRIGV